MDTSVVVAAFATWHEHHAAARTVVDAGARLVAHCGFETYAVLTRMPAPHRASPEVVQTYLRARFPKGWLGLPASESAKLVGRLAGLGVAGGSTYDALVAATAKHAGATLVTADRRAVRIYDAVGVRYQLLF